MATVPASTMSGAEMVDLCKRHTIYEWSAQSMIDPIPVARAEGVYFWTPEGKRYLDFNSQLMCTNIGHGHPAVVRAIQEQAASWRTPIRSWPPRPAHGWARSSPRSRRATSTLLLHERRRRSQRERDPHRPYGHGPTQGARTIPVISRRHRRRPLADRRSSPLGGGAGPSGNCARPRVPQVGPQGPEPVDAALAISRRRDPATRAPRRSRRSSSSRSSAQTGSSSRRTATWRVCGRSATGTASC